MKKVFIGGVGIVALVLGILIVLRRMEPMVPSLPTAPPPETAPVSQTPTSRLPVETPGTEAPGTFKPGQITAKPSEDTGLPDSLLALLATAKTLWPMPNTVQVRNDCFANPRLAAERLGVKPPEPPGVTRQVASMLCKRDNSGCDTLTGTVSNKASISGCMHPPCSDPVFLSASESMGGGAQDCRQWTSYMLFEESALAGRTGLPACKTFLPLLDLQLSDADMDRFCGLLASDIRTGEYSFCHELSSKPRGGQKFSLQECVKPMESYLKGLEGCPKGDPGKSLKFNRPSCALQARVREALTAKDLEPCNGDPLCYAFMSPGCEPEHFVDFNNPGWKSVCDGAVSSSLQAWFKNVDARFASTRDDLRAFKTKLDTLPKDARERAAGRISGALGNLDKAKAQADKLRHGSILEPKEPSASRPSEPHRKRRKGAKKR